MHPSKPPVDEYTLAAFLAGTLTEEQHDEVVAFLADNADARELLHMASEALVAATTTEENIDTKPGREKPPRMPDRQSDRAAKRPVSRFRRIGKYALGALIFLAVGISLRLAFNPSPDTLRSFRPEEVIELNVQTSIDDLRFQWNEVPDAYKYTIVIWDVIEARVVDQIDMDGTTLDREDLFIRDLLSQLESNHSYSIRVDAFDAQNRRIRSSNRVDFTLND